MLVLAALKKKRKKKDGWTMPPDSSKRGLCPGQKEVGSREVDQDAKNASVGSTAAKSQSTMVFGCIPKDCDKRWELQKQEQLAKKIRENVAVVTRAFLSGHFVGCHGENDITNENGNVPQIFEGYQALPSLFFDQILGINTVRAEKKPPLWHLQWLKERLSRHPCHVSHGGVQQVASQSAWIPKQASLL